MWELSPSLKVRPSVEVPTGGRRVQKTQKPFQAPLSSWDFAFTGPNHLGYRHCVTQGQFPCPVVNNSRGRGRAENSALEKRASSRGAPNEMGHPLRDNGRRTGATITTGSTPVPETSFPVYGMLKPCWRISDPASISNPSALSEPDGSTPATGNPFSPDPSPGEKPGGGPGVLLAQYMPHCLASAIGQAASRSRAGKIPARQPINRRVGRDNLPSQWPSLGHRQAPPPRSTPSQRPATPAESIDLSPLPSA